MYISASRNSVDWYSCGGGPSMDLASHSENSHTFVLVGTLSNHVSHRMRLLIHISKFRVTWKYFGDTDLERLRYTVYGREDLLETCIA